MAKKRKVLISVLGTGNFAADALSSGYEKTDYEIEGKVYKDNTLLALPLMEHLGINDLYLVGTNASMWDNVYDSFEHSEEEKSSMKILFKRFFKSKSAYSQALLKKIAKAKDRTQKFPQEELLQEEDLEELNQLINQKLESKKSKCFLVENVTEEDQLWLIFEKFLEIFKSLDEEKAEVELYLDITHGFRFIPIFSIVIAQFSKIRSNTKISGIYYGQLIRDKSQASPVFDFSIFFEILDWAQAIKDLKAYGNANEILKLINKDKENLEIQKNFKSFANALSLSDLAAIQSSLLQVKRNIKLYQEHNKVLINILAEELISFLAFFDDIESQALHKFQFDFAKYYAKNDNYSMAYLTLQEAIISALCKKHNKNPELEKDRNFIKNLFQVNLSKTIISKDKDLQAKEYYRQIKKIRDNIAHKTNSLKSGTPTPNKSVEDFDLYCKFFQPLFK